MSQERHKILAAIYLLLIKGNRIAMIRRYNTGYQDGNYTLPSGHIDAGETALQAVVHEAKEEVGVDVARSDLKLAHCIHRNSTDKVYVDFYFVASAWQGEPFNAEPDKSDDLTWFELNKLPTNVIPDVKQAIELYQQGVSYSEAGW